MAGRPRSRETPAEGRARRAAVEDPAVVLEAAARFLEVRHRSIAEVRRRLNDNGYRDDLVEGAIARLADLGMLDDAAFARAWIESRDRARPRGARALRDELRRKGVAREHVEAALAAREAIAAGTDEDEAIEPGPSERADSRTSDGDAGVRLLARRGATLLREPDPRRRRAKAYALLARSGFDPEVCREAIGAWLDESASDPEEGSDPGSDT